MRILGIDYGDARVGTAITDELGITAQGLKTIAHNGNDKILLAKLDEIMNEFSISTIVVGMPLNMDGSKTERVEKTQKFIHKLKCKYNKIKIETIGVPSISSLSKSEYAQFISSLEFQIREYYKNLSTKKDKKPP